MVEKVEIPRTVLQAAFELLQGGAYAGVPFMHIAAVVQAVEASLAAPGPEEGTDAAAG